MKKYIQDIYQRFRQTYISINVKWTVLTSFFIFVLLTCFSVIIYTASTNLLLKEEKLELEEIASEVQARLETSDEELTMESVTEYLKKENNFIYSEKKKMRQENQSWEAGLLQLDSFISAISAPELSLDVYNRNKQRVFSLNKELNLSVLPAGDGKIRLKKIDGITGFLLRRPIYNRSTNEVSGYLLMFYELTNIYKIKHYLLFAVIIFEICVIFISSLLGYLFSSYFFKPLEKITGTMQHIKQTNQLEERIEDYPYRDEISDITIAFNEMLDQLQKLLDGQQEFVEDVSHELRTPVAIIEGHLGLLMRWGKDDPEVLEESLQASIQEVHRMKHLIQEMLDLTRMEQLKFQVTHEVIHPVEVVEQTINNLRLIHPDFQFNLSNALDKEVSIKISHHHFEQLLIILLDNAIKYSDKSNQIEIHIRQMYNQVFLSIQDFGEGLSKKDAGKIFNRFFRVDKARTRKTGGNGLGLPIAQKLVESYEGTINVESQLHVGTTFTISFPIVEEFL